MAAGARIGVVAATAVLCSEPSTRRSTREAGCDLVHCAMQVVDPALQRDREVDDVGAATAEQRRWAARRQPDPEPGARPQRDDRGRRGGDRDGGSRDIGGPPGDLASLVHGLAGEHEEAAATVWYD